MWIRFNFFLFKLFSKFRAKDWHPWQFYGVLVVVMIVAFCFIHGQLCWETSTIMKVHCAIKEAIAKQISRQINICILTVLVFNLYVWKRHRLTASKYHINRNLLLIRCRFDSNLTEVFIVWRSVWVKIWVRDTNNIKFVHHVVCC